MNGVEDAASALRAEAERTNERRLLVLHGAREACYDAASRALAATDLTPDAERPDAERPDADPSDAERPDVAIVGERDLPFAPDRHPTSRAGALLGTTRDAVVLDCHDACRPNALGRAAGAVDGGGLLVLLAPPLDDWPDRRDEFDEGLAVPPFGVDDVSGNFRARLVRALRAHPGVAIVDAVADRVERDGLTDPAPRRPSPPATPPDPDERAFPDVVYEACRTPDQAAAVRALESLAAPGNAVVVESDRGRGKSSAAGLAATGLLAAGKDVLVTAPGYRNAAEVFARAREALAALGVDYIWDEETRRLDAPDGTLRYERPPAAAAIARDADAVVVDEAAALPVRLLSSLLPEGDAATATSLAFATTVHGYEGAGRGFAVRFRDRLAESGLSVTDVSLSDPIRYAAGDPVEVWSFRALGLDARPAVDPLVEDASPGDVEYAALDQAALARDERLLCEAFGLLVAAHYRTEPDDLARLLDAPNVRVRALLADGHVVSVVLLAREGGLSAERRTAMYEGARVRGNMLPDVLTSQLRDEAAGVPVGLRVLRIATHHAARSRGLGSELLAAVEREFADETDAGDPVDWLGVGYGATPELLRFWRRNDYRTVHLSTTRNETSGEYSALMLRPLTARGRALADRSASWFGRRAAGVLADALDDADPDVVRLALRDAAVDRPALTDREWRVVASAAYGPGLYDVAPGPFRRLAMRYFADPDAPALGAAAERLLVRKALQARPWADAVADLDYVSRRQCMRALGEAYRPLVDAYGGDAAREEVARYE